MQYYATEAFPRSVQEKQDILVTYCMYIPAWTYPELYGASRCTYESYFKGECCLADDNTGLANRITGGSHKRSLASGSLPRLEVDCLCDSPKWDDSRPAFMLLLDGEAIKSVGICHRDE